MNDWLLISNYLCFSNWQIFFCFSQFLSNCLQIMNEIYHWKVLADCQLQFLNSVYEHEKENRYIDHRTKKIPIHLPSPSMNSHHDYDECFGIIKKNENSEWEKKWKLNCKNSRNNRYFDSIYLWNHWPISSIENFFLFRLNVCAV